MPERGGIPPARPHSPGAVSQIPLRVIESDSTHCDIPLFKPFTKTCGKMNLLVDRVQDISLLAQ
jgi:hypothetical protein